MYILLSLASSATAVCRLCNPHVRRCMGKCSFVFVVFVAVECKEFAEQYRYRDYPHQPVIVCNNIARFILYHSSTCNAMLSCGVCTIRTRIQEIFCFTNTHSHLLLPPVHFLHLFAFLIVFRCLFLWNSGNILMLCYAFHFNFCACTA